ncbi:MAG: hypothetical protein P1U68_17570 [Verrucomicrobiales bacterium]|nr:hypothetical protein [Verrucomicrobiales bacterium]
MKSISLNLFLVSAAAALFCHADESGILGTWRAVEQDSGYFKQVEFVVRGGKVEMRTWSSVNGGEISSEAEVVKTSLSGSEAAAAKPGDVPFVASKQFSFKNSNYVTSLTENGLHITASDDYTDDSGRETRTSELHFVRGSYSDSLAQKKGDDIPGTGWLGIWKNRDESTRGIAQLTIRDLDPVTMSTWGIMSNGISSRPGTTVALPLTSEEASAADAKGRIQATTDLGWAKITYSMKLHRDGLDLETETDYKDPDRGDQTFEYEFVRGAWED